MNALPAIAHYLCIAPLQAKFTPLKLDGEPVKVTGVIEYNFVAQ